MNVIDYLEIAQQTTPEIIVAVTMFVILAIDLGMMRGQPVESRHTVAAGLTGTGCLVAIGWLWQLPGTTNLLNGAFVVNPLIVLLKMILLLLTLFTALISSESRFTPHAGEYFVLLLLGTLGLMFLISAEEILMIFVSLELTSLSLYLLTAFAKQNRDSAEAAFKYFLFGSVSAAFLLFGLSLIYGLTGETGLAQIAAQLPGHTAEPLFLLALVMILMGFGFKVAAAPFHFWAPDAYQGAPTPSAAFIASSSKVGSFFILAKVLMLGFAGAAGRGAWRDFSAGWIPILAVMAILSMGLGNLAAITQVSIKRLLAYSAIAHAGYMLVGLMANNLQGITSLLYYVVTYALTTVGAFGVVAVVGEGRGKDAIASFAGLSRRSPLLALCMMVFMLSLAGIPPFAGFFGKFYLFTAAVGAFPERLGLLWLVIFALAMSVVSLYYYLQVLKQIYMVEAAPEVPALRPQTATLWVLVLLAMLVLGLGVMPQVLLNRLQWAIAASGM